MLPFINFLSFRKIASKLVLQSDTTIRNNSNNTVIIFYFRKTHICDIFSIINGTQVSLESDLYNQSVGKLFICLL